MSNMLSEKNMDDLTEYEGSLRTNDKGELMIANRAYFDQFFRDNPSASFHLKVVKESSNSRRKLFGYYFNEVIPKVRKGYHNLGEHLSKSETDERMSFISRTCIDDHLKDLTGGSTEVIRTYRLANELNYFQLKRHIQEVIIFAAENLEVTIEEPI